MNLYFGSNENVEEVIIQYSGRDFVNYQYDPTSDGYCFTSYSQVDTGSINTTTTFTLKEPNLNVEIGDYIMSTDLNFPFRVISTGVNVTQPNNAIGTSLILKRQITYNEQSGNQQYIYGIEESINERVILFEDNNNRKPVIIKENGSLNVTCNSNNCTYTIDGKAEGYLFGKKYQPTIESSVNPDIGFYLVPEVSVTNISPDRRTITTSVNASGLFNPTSDTYIQFCRRGKLLNLNLIQNLGSQETSIGNGAVINIDRISGGRITNIVVNNGGRNFLQSNQPIVTVGNYDYYVA